MPVRSATCVEQKFGPFFQFILLGDRVEIDVAQPLDLFAKLPDFVGDRVPIDVAGLISGAAVGAEAVIFGRQIELQFLDGSLHERFQAHLQFAQPKLQRMQRLLDLGMLAAKAFDFAGQRLDGLRRSRHCRAATADSICLRRSLSAA